MMLMIVVWLVTRVCFVNIAINSLQQSCRLMVHVIHVIVAPTEKYVYLDQVKWGNNINVLWRQVFKLRYLAHLINTSYLLSVYQLEKGGVYGTTNGTECQGLNLCIARSRKSNLILSALTLDSVYQPLSFNSFVSSHFTFVFCVHWKFACNYEGRVSIVHM